MLKNGSATEINLTYFYNSLNRLTDVINGSETTSYTYDNIGRLKTEQSAGEYKNTYYYDKNQNRSQNIYQDLVSGTNKTTDYIYDLNNRLQSLTETVGEIQNITDFTYDANGNQLYKLKSTIMPDAGEGMELLLDSNSDYVESYEYDVFNRLTHSTVSGITTFYTYDANNLRQSKTTDENTTKHVYDGANVVMDIVGGTKQTYIRGNGLIARNVGSIRTYYHFNPHGDTIALTNSSGTITADYRYDAFGNPLPQNANDTNPFRYCGEYTDLETNLIYLRARYYDPATSRMLTEDPARSGTNWYIYCNNNPIMYIDPSGLTMILTGTGDEVSKIWGSIKEFSQDGLVLTQQKDADGNLIDSYTVTVAEERSGGCNVGTDLVRRLVYSDKTVTVQVTTDGNSESDVDSANAINGKGSDTNVYFNPNSNPDILTKDPATGNVAPAKRPAFIGLAHEFIHADRSMRGKAINYSKKADYQYQTSRTKWTWGPLWGYDYTYAKENVPKEELATVGLGYNNWWGDITENMIRAEHGINPRGAY